MTLTHIPVQTQCPVTWPLRRTSHLALLSASHLALLGTLTLASCSDEPAPSPSPSPVVDTPTASPGPAGTLLNILAPHAGEWRAGSTTSLYFEYSETLNPQALEVWLDETRLESALSCDAELLRCRLPQVPVSPGNHTFRVVAVTASGERVQARQTFEQHAGALVRETREPYELIDGPEARAQLGDYRLYNGQLQVLISKLGRYFDYIHTYGGHPIDADLQREPWENERDGFGIVAPAINIESSDHPQSLEVINDGRDGKAAILEVRGPDELLVALNPSTMAPLLIPPSISEGPLGTYVPASADDTDLPLEVTTRYILEPDKPYVTIESTLQNTGSSEVRFYLGDYLNATGEVDYFSPGFGFRANIYFRHEGDFFAFTGFGLNQGVTYGLIPETPRSTSVSLPGTFITFAGQDAQAVFFQASAPDYVLKAGASLLYRRFLAVGSHVADVSSARCDALKLSCGEVRGKVLQNGQPVAGANVTLWRPSTPTELYTNRTEQIITHWRTLADGTYQGRVEPGTYRLSAELPHAAYPTRTGTPPEKEVTVVAQESSTVSEFSFEDPGIVRVRVRDAQGQPLTARITLAGFDPSTDPLVKPVTFPGYDSTGAYFSDPYADELPHGISRVALTPPDGDSGELAIEPGSYWLVVSHGPWFSAWSQKITVPPAPEKLELDVQLAQVIERAGFVSGDFHVHGIDSFDARITRTWRMRGMAAEQVDVFASTDHNSRIDFGPALAAEGLSDQVIGLVGEEITTFDLGHFNAFPLPLTTAANGGSIDWAGPFEPGKSHPSQGRYDLSPSDFFQKVMEEAGDQILMVNHPNTRTLGYFSLIGLNTGEPEAPRAYVPNCLFRQAPGVELWSDAFTALELWRIYEDEPTLLAAENLGDFFNLLNRGIVRTSLSNSDTHSSIYMPVGGPRNLIAVSEDLPFTAEAYGPEVARRIREGRVINTNAPLIDLRITALSTGEQAGHRVGLPTQVKALDGQVKVQVQLQSAAWAPFDEIQLYVNHAPTPTFDDKDDAPGRTYPFSNCEGSEVTMTDVPRFDVQPLESLRFLAGRDFEVQTVVDDPTIPGAAHLEAGLEVPLTLTEDSWVLVLVKGTPGISAPLFPMQPSGLDEDLNTSVDDLMDGNLDEGGVMAQAFTNPLFVDVDGNGRYDAPGLKLTSPARVRVRTLRREQ